MMNGKEKLKRHFRSVGKIRGWCGEAKTSDAVKFKSRCCDNYTGRCLGRSSLAPLHSTSGLFLSAGLGCYQFRVIPNDFS